MNIAWSQPQIERVLACHLSLESTESDLEGAKGEAAELKKQLAERLETLHSTIGEAREKFNGKSIDNGAQSAIFNAEGDYHRTLEQWELKDRHYRRLMDQAKKLLARLLHVLTENRQGEDLFTNAKGKKAEDKNAWLLVPLADLLGEMIARPFADCDVYTVGEFLEGWLLAGGKAGGGEWNGEIIKVAYVDYAASQVAAYAGSRGKGESLPDGFEFGDGAPIPDAPEPEYKAKPAASPDEGDNSDEAGGDATMPQDGPDDDADNNTDDDDADRQRSATPREHATERRVWLDRSFMHANPLPRRTPNEITPQYGVLSACGATTPALFLRMLNREWEARDAKKIRDGMPALADWMVLWICDTIADKLRDYGNPEVWEILDSLIARCERAFDELTAGSRLATVARWPADQRYAHALPPVEIGPDGKKVKAAKPPHPPVKKRGEKFTSGAPKKKAAKKAKKSGKPAAAGKGGRR